MSEGYHLADTSPISHRCVPAAAVGARWGGAPVRRRGRPEAAPKDGREDGQPLL